MTDVHDVVGANAPSSHEPFREALCAHANKILVPTTDGMGIKCADCGARYTDGWSAAVNDDVVDIQKSESPSA